MNNVNQDLPKRTPNNRSARVTSCWSTVKLGEVLRRSEETVQPRAESEYREITVRLWGKGVVERGRVLGAALSGRRFPARTGQFITSRIDARNGAMGLVPHSLDGALVTNDFPLFELNKDRLEPAFIDWLCRTAGFVELCLLASEGTTNRVRLKEERFLALEIPLPPLAEQRRVVAQIGGLAAQIDEARALRRQAAEEAAVLLPSGMAEIVCRLGEEHPTRKLDTLCDVVRGGSPRPAGSPLYYGGKIPFLKVGDLTKDDGMYVCAASSTVNDLGREQSRYIEPDTLMLTNSGATLGVPKITKIAGCFNDGSQAFLNVDSSIEKEYLYYFFKSKTLWFREHLARGQGQPNLNTDMTKQMDVPVPPLHEQRRIVGELDALLPAILDRAFKGEL